MKLGLTPPLSSCLGSHRAPVFRTAQRWRQRIESRVALAVITITAVSLACSLVTANRVFTEYSLRKSEQALVATSAAFQHLVKSRTDLIASHMRTIAGVPAFRASMDIHDAATIQQMAKDYRKTLGASFCVVTDRRGVVLGSPGWPKSAGLPSARLQAVKDSSAGRSYAGVVPIEGRLYLVISEPGRFAEEVIGTLTSGYELDSSLARSLSEITRCDVNFVIGSEVCGSSLPLREQRALEGTFRRWPGYLGAAGGSPELRTVGDRSFVGAVYPIASGTSTATARLVLLQDWRPTSQLIHNVARILLFSSIAVLLLALAAGIAFSRRLVRPFHDIAEAAEEIGGGNWSRQVPVRGGVEAVTMAIAFNRMSAGLSRWHEEAISQAKRSEKALSQLSDSYTATLQALSRALDARDNETEGHSVRVTSYALKLADAMGVDSQTRARLKLGALLHDIGKIGIPDAILRKPGRLTDEEMAQMREHCAYGLNIVRGIPHLEAAMVVVGSHHERWDGKGYPAGLSGCDIPLEARIFAVCDTLDAITSDRPYRRGRSFGEARTEIQRCSGSQFDPAVVDALERLFPQLSNGPELLAVPDTPTPSDVVLIATPGAAASDLHGSP